MLLPQEAGTAAEMAVSWMRKDCSCWKEVGLAHSGGRAPVRVLLPPNSRSTSEGRLPQEDGRLPFNKGSPDRSKLERAGKAAGCAHAAGKEPVGHHQRQNHSHCINSIASVLVTACA